MSLNLGILASGSGSNLQAIVDACERGDVVARVKVVISDKAGAYALERARAKGIAAVHINPKEFSGKEFFEAEIVRVLQLHEVELVCLAGYMRLVGDKLLGAFPQRVMNIHPALLPAFPGLHGQQQAFDYGVRFSGCTVHFVDHGMDTGPIILQAVVPVLTDDTAESLAARILEQEHKIYPQAIQLYAEGRLRVVGRKVIVAGS
ncbi:MAG: phosphoribosylglycinamide formyltransferase [Clostridia bacterium]|nr:phosphoribosylglycinamide formyltransferase [Clostridia bacterium]